MNLITNDSEFVWLNMLNDRSLLSQAHRHDLSLQILERIKNDYKQVFNDMLSQLKKI